MSKGTIAMKLKFVTQFQALKWPIRYKVGVVFGLVFLCFALNGVISLVLLYNNRTTQERQAAIAIYSQQLQRYTLAYNSEYEVYNNNTHIYKAKSVVIDLVLAELARDSAQLRATDAANQKFVNAFSDLYTTARNDFFVVQEFLTSGDQDAALQIWTRDQPDFDKVTALLNQRAEELKVEQASANSDQDNTVFLSTLTVVGLTLVSIIAGLVVLLLIEFVIVKPLNQLQESWRNVSQGDLEQKLVVPNGDEVGELARSLSSALSSFQQVVRGVKITNNLHIMASQLAHASQQQLDGTNQQLSAITQVTAVMEELERGAAQIAENASRVSEVVEQNLTQIKQVQMVGEISQSTSQQIVQVVEHTLVGVEEVGTQVTEINERMSQLTEQSQEINKVVDLLSGIATELHLLSLNAAIEAAGAGVFGERFAVVARHTRQLAGKAYNATQEAVMLVTGVKQSVLEVQQQVKSGQSQISSIIEANMELRQDLHELEECAAQVSQAVANLSSQAFLVQEQAEAIREATFQQHISDQQVLDSTRSVGEVAQTTVNITQQIAISSNELENMSVQLNGVLGQIRLAA